MEICFEPQRTIWLELESLLRLNPGRKDRVSNKLRRHFAQAGIQRAMQQTGLSGVWV
jgi:hypothetical protein